MQAYHGEQGRTHIPQLKQIRQSQCERRSRRLRLIFDAYRQWVEDGTLSTDPEPYGRSAPQCAAEPESQPLVERFRPAFICNVGMYVRLSLKQPEDLDQGSNVQEHWGTGDYGTLKLLCQCCCKGIRLGNSVVGLESSSGQHAWPIHGLLAYGQLINENQCGNRQVSIRLALGDTKHFPRMYQP